MSNLMSIGVVEETLVSAAAAVGVEFTAVDLKTMMNDGRLVLRDRLIRAEVEFVDDRLPRAFTAARHMPRAERALVSTPVQLSIRLDDPLTVEAWFAASEFEIKLVRGLFFEAGTAIELSKAAQQVIADELAHALRLCLGRGVDNVG